MTKLVDLISAEVSAAFAAAGFDADYGKVTVSNRPDLREFQCNGSLPAAKQYKAAPIKIAQAVAQALAGSEMFSSVDACMPGFINLKLSGAYLRDYLREMQTTAAPMWQSRCMLGTCAVRSLARVLSASTVTLAMTSPAISTWATGACRWA